MRATIDLDAYFQRIGHDGPTAPTLATLEALHLAHPQAIPFENLDPLIGRPVTLDAAALERKLVLAERGGYCFEQNALFRLVLAALGFGVQPLVGRTLWQQPANARPSRGHMALRVEIDGEAYLADVGFGAMTLTAPLRLVPDLVQETPHGTFRLTADGTGHKVEAKVGGDWRTLYRIDPEPPTELEIAFANHYLSSHPDSPFTAELMAARPLGDVRYTLRNTRLTAYRSDGSQERTELQTADALRQALQDTFGLALPEGPALDAALAQLAGSAGVAPAGVTLRPATRADDAACGRIISVATLAAPTADRLPHARALFEDTSPLDPEGWQRLVAEDGEVVGFADYDPARRRVRYLFVDPAAPGRGIGWALVERVREMCDGQALTLTCFAVNDRALAWYLGRGFVITGGGIVELAGQPVIELRLRLPPRR